MPLPKLGDSVSIESEKIGNVSDIDAYIPHLSQENPVAKSTRSGKDLKPPAKQSEYVK